MKLTTIIASFVIIAITIVIISLILIQMNTKSGCGCGVHYVAATANRTSNDSITITYHGGADADMVAINDAFIIQVNDKNATNGDAIGQSGLAATLDPATGLENKVGSTINITGSDISYKTHVVVAANYKDNSREVILDTNV